MKRRRLHAYAEEVGRDLEGKPYNHWAKKEFPINYETILDGQEVHVEIDRLELTDEYVHLGIGICSHSSLFSCYFPACTSVIIQKTSNEKGRILSRLDEKGESH